MTPRFPARMQVRFNSRKSVHVGDFVFRDSDRLDGYRKLSPKFSMHVNKVETNFF